MSRFSIITTNESLTVNAEAEVVYDISDEESMDHDQNHSRVQSHSDSAVENDSSSPVHHARRRPRDNLSYDDPSEDTNRDNANPEESPSRPRRHGHGQNHRTRRDSRSDRPSHTSSPLSASEAEKKIQELLECLKHERRNRKHDERELKTLVEKQNGELQRSAICIETLEKQLVKNEKIMNKVLNERDRIREGLTHHHDRAERYHRDLEHTKVQNRELQGLFHSTKTQLEGTQRSKKELEDLLETKTAELQSSMAFLRKDDTISGADVMRKVKDLNEEIAAFTAQIGVFEEEMFEEMTREEVGLRDGKGLDVTITEILGQDVTQYLFSMRGEEEAELAAQCALQALLLDTCVRLISRWTLETSIDAILKRMHARLLQTGKPQLFFLK
jgi:hypothetical protein